MPSILRAMVIFNSFYQKVTVVSDAEVDDKACREAVYETVERFKVQNAI